VSLIAATVVDGRPPLSFAVDEFLMRTTMCPEDICFEDEFVGTCFGI
jgi:hypothetical protein